MDQFQHYQILIGHVLDTDTNNYAMGEHFSNTFSKTENQ